MLVKIKRNNNDYEITPQRILCFITENIGDTLRASGVIEFLNIQFKPHFVCTEYNREILKLFRVDEKFLISLKRDPGIFDLIRILKKSKSYKWDTSIVLDYTKIKDFAIYTSKFMGIRKIIYKNFTDKDYESLRVIAEESRIDILTVAKHLIVKEHFDLPLKKGIIAVLDDKFSKYKDYIGIHVGGFGSILYPVSRKYPEIYTFQLIESLLQEGHKILITGDSFDQKSFRKFSIKLITRYKNFLDLTGKLSLTELASLLKNLKLYITPDNGTLHLAQTVGCRRIIAILGPTSPLLVHGENTKIVRIDLKCSPCLKFLKFPDKCINSNSHSCLWNFKPAMLLPVVQKQLNSS